MTRCVYFINQVFQTECRGILGKLFLGVNGIAQAPQGNANSLSYGLGAGWVPGDTSQHFRRLFDLSTAGLDYLPSNQGIEHKRENLGLLGNLHGAEQAGFSQFVLAYSQMAVRQVVANPAQAGLLTQDFEQADPLLK